MNGHSKPSPWKVAWQQGRSAAWKNRWPALFLTCFGFAIVLGYYQVDSVRNVLEAVGQYKVRIGYLFGILSTAFFGGLLPMVLPSLFGRRLPARFGFLLIANVLFWAYKGLEVDLLYQGQAWLFGDDAGWKTVSCKVLLDQMIYAPTCGLLNCVLFYVWRDNNFSLVETRTSLGPQWYSRKVLPALISNWCVWLPSVLLIYNLPLALQLPVQNLILCFWVLVLEIFTSAEADSSES